MRKPLLVLTLVTLAVSVCLAQSKAPAAKKGVFHTPADLKWVDVPGASGVQRAVLWGNPDKGASGSLVKFAAGTEVPLHSHTADVRAVVVSGTVLSGLEGEKPKEFGPQSYIFHPGGLKHTTGCKRGSDCVFFTMQPAAFDLKPVEAGAAKK